MPELLAALAALATLAALVMCCLGCAILALLQREHWMAAAGELPRPSARRAGLARLVAAALLAGALVPCVAGHGAGFGMLLWMMLLGAGGLCVAFTLAWRPRWLAPVAFFMFGIV